MHAVGYILRIVFMILEFPHNIYECIYSFENTVAALPFIIISDLVDRDFLQLILFPVRFTCESTYYISNMHDYLNKQLLFTLDIKNDCKLNYR